jgi:protein TonB
VEDSLPRQAARFTTVLGLHGLLVLVLLQLQDGTVPEPTPIRMAVRMIEMPAATPAPKPEARPQAPEAPVAPMPLPPPVRRPEPRSEPRTVRTPVAAPETAPVAPAPVQEMPRAAAPALPAVTAVRFDADYLNNPAPRYPTFSRRRGEQGRVLLQVKVDASGQPEQVEIHEGSGHARLDAAALEAVRRWRFIPARQGGKAIAASVLVPILFQLER